MTRDFVKNYPVINFCSSTKITFLLVALCLNAQIVGTLWLPSVHFFFDAVGVRDGGTVWHANSFNTFFDLAMAHSKGPLHFILLNLYYNLIGNCLPLNPLTAQFPNGLCVCLIVLFSFLLGKDLHSERFGLLLAVSITLTPWLASTIRYPWFYNTLAILMHLVCLYSSIRLIRNPTVCSKLSFSLSLTVYLLVGLDWPSFLMMLFLFFLFSRSLKAITGNIFNLLPVSTMALFGFWALRVYMDNPKLLCRSLIIYPFLKFNEYTSVSVDSLVLLWQSFGITYLLAILFIILAVIQKVKVLRRETQLSNSHAERTQSSGSKSLVGPCVIWVLCGSYFFCTATRLSTTYAYVVAFPVAFLCSLALSRCSNVFLIPIIAIMLLLHWNGLFYDTRIVARHYDDQRVLAAACFLIEQRPDLLEASKTAFLPRHMAANVGQYARGTNQRIVMPLFFPAMSKKLSNPESAEARVFDQWYPEWMRSFGSRKAVLHEFVRKFENTGRINADWLIIESNLLEVVPPKGRRYYWIDPVSVDFYKRLLKASHVSWIVCLEDNSGRRLWIGEVANDHCVNLDSAPTLRVGPLAKRYSQVYDSISFLKKNMQGDYRNLSANGKYIFFY